MLPLLCFIISRTLCETCKVVKVVLRLCYTELIDTYSTQLACRVVVIITLIIL